MGFDLDILVKKIKKDDEEAFRRVYDFYKSRLYYFALKFTKRGVYAEEIVQEVFIKIWENRRKLNPELSFRSYIFTITYHTLINFLKKAALDEKTKHELCRIFTESERVAETGPDYESEKMLHEAIDGLPPRRKEIFRLAKLQGKSYAEIAAELNISKDTVRLQIIEANKTIKEFFRKRRHLITGISLLTWLFWV